MTVTDPAGRYGRPRLELAEMWSRIGAAEVISSAIDQKTRLLMLLVLVLGTVFTASAVAASVRSPQAGARRAGRAPAGRGGPCSA